MWLPLGANIFFRREAEVGLGDDVSIHVSNDVSDGCLESPLGVVGPTQNNQENFSLKVRRGISCVTSDTMRKWRFLIL